MSCSQPTDCGPAAVRDQAADDKLAQRVVLGFILEEHPTHLTIPEVCRALYAQPGDFAANDAIERAIRDLDGAGLLSCPGGKVILPTRAALSFQRLEVE
jgi:hypothetical protein